MLKKYLTGLHGVMLCLLPMISFAGVKVSWEPVENQNVEVITERHKVQDFVFKELQPAGATNPPAIIEKLHSEDLVIVTSNVKTGSKGNDNAIPIWMKFISQEHYISNDTSEKLIPRLKAVADYSGVSMKGEINHQGTTVFHTVKPEELPEEVKQILRVAFSKAMNINPKTSLDLEYRKPYVVKTSLDENLFGVVGVRGEQVTTYTLLDVTDGIAKISYESEAKTDVMVTSEQGQSGVEIAPQPTIKGEFTYDVKNRLDLVHKVVTVIESVVPSDSAKVEVKAVQTDITTRKLIE